MPTGTADVVALLAKVPTFETLGEPDLLEVAKVAVPTPDVSDRVAKS